MLKVLIVEDETLVTRLYQKMAENDGFEVEIAKNGLIGIEKAKNWKPDIIIMDIMMPEMNGIEALEKLQKDPDTSDIPVIIATNMSGEHDAKLAISKGAVKFLVKKDLNPDSFKETIMSVLKS